MAGCSRKERGGDNEDEEEDHRMECERKTQDKTGQIKQCTGQVLGDDPKCFRV